MELTAEDRAIFASLDRRAAKSYARAHTADSAASDLWRKRRAYVDPVRRVRCLGDLASYWEVVQAARKSYPRDDKASAGKVAKKFCRTCARRHAFAWTCRGCGRKVCEHFCGNKDGDAATCVSCRLAAH